MGWKLEDLPPHLRQQVRDAEAKKKTPREAPKAPPEIPAEEQPTEEDPVDLPRVHREGDKLTVWLEPIGAPRQTQRDRWKPSDAVLRYRAFKDKLRPVVPPDLLERCCGFSYVAYFALSESWSIKKKVRTAGQPHEHKPDADNIWKCLTDCLFPDADSQLYMGSMEKLWDDGDGPRVEMTFHQKKMPATTDAFRDAVEEAHSTGKRLELERYYSDQGKKCSTMIVRLLPEDGYDDLVRESVEEFEEREDEIVAALLEKFPGEVDLVTKCCGEQLRSWQRRLDGQDSGHNNVGGKEELENSGKGYWTKPSDPFATVVFRMERLEETVHQERPRTGGKVGKTVIKNTLKKMLPLGRYIGRLNLDVDNVDDVRVLED